MFPWYNIDIILALIRIRPKGEYLLWRIMRLLCKSNSSLGEYHIGTIWYNIARYYTSADSRSTEGRASSLANHAHPSESTMFEKHGIISVDIIPAPIYMIGKCTQFVSENVNNKATQNGG